MFFAVRRLKFTVLPLMAAVVSLTLAAGAPVLVAEEEKPAAAPDQAVKAAQPDVRAFIDKVAEKTKDCRSFRARFVQKKMMAISKEPVVSEGVFSYLLRADGKPLVRWDTQKPGPGQCLVTARELAVYYVDLKEAEIYELSRTNPLLTRLMLAPRIGSGIFEAFSVELEQTGGTDGGDGREGESPDSGSQGDKSDPESDKTAGTGSEGTRENKEDSGIKDAPNGGPPAVRRHVLLLKPTDPELAKFIEHVRLWLGADTLLVERLEYKDTSKDVTFVEFHDTQVNAELNESEFVLDLPADVKVKRFSAKEADSAGR